MRAIVLSVVMVASPALAQLPATPTPVPQVATPPADAPVSTAVPAPQAAPEVPQAIDPLADLISQSAQTTDEEEAETANKPAPKHRGAILPIPPPEATTAPDGEPTRAQVYEMRVKGSVAAAQSLQGPLDGGWKIVGADGGQIYALQIVDKAGGYGELEGAWRDLRRPGSVGSTGLVEDLRREGDAVVVRFSPRVGQSSVLSLRPSGYEHWSGELAENGASVAVVAEHILPQAPPGYETDRRGPYVWPVAQRAAVSRPAPAAPACSTKGKKGKALKAAKAKCAAAAKKSKGSTARKGKGGKASKATAAKRSKATASKKKKKR
uniref:hypothetical protein n=1 Tax=uncultured Caulobacter sp. TaxID=158749 RepID=UPI0025D0B5A1|nr:hypothetical protein [uncultured Caulobacter sp.]